MRWLFRAALVAAGLMFLQPSDAAAWGYDAHRAVCAMGWDFAKPATRRAIQRILGQKGRAAFAESCLWADAVIPLRRETAPWHYINTPRDAPMLDLKRDCPADTGCVVSAIAEQERILRNATHPDVRRDALRYLAHLIGDVNQPLHIGFADDRGGNLIKGAYLGKPINIHGLWDYRILEEMHEPWPALTKRLEREITRSNRATWTNTEAPQWAEESFIAARAPQVAYRPDSQGFDWDESYADMVLPIIDERLKMSGIRLAYTLDRALTPSKTAP